MQSGLDAMQRGLRLAGGLPDGLAAQIDAAVGVTARLMTNRSSKRSDNSLRKRLDLEQDKCAGDAQQYEGCEVAELQFPIA